MTRLSETNKLRWVKRLKDSGTGHAHTTTVLQQLFIEHYVTQSEAPSQPSRILHHQCTREVWKDVPVIEE